MVCYRQLPTFHYATQKVILIADSNKKPAKVKNWGKN